MQIEFKFSVGDFVTPAGVALACERKNTQPLLVAQVLERVSVECSGGVQLFYNVRLSSSGNVDDNIVRFNEIELLPLVLIK